MVCLYHAAATKSLKYLRLGYRSRTACGTGFLKYNEGCAGDNPQTRIRGCRVNPRGKWGKGCGFTHWRPEARTNLLHTFKIEVQCNNINLNSSQTNYLIHILWSQEESHLQDSLCVSGEFGALKAIGTGLGRTQTLNGSTLRLAGRALKSGRLLPQTFHFHPRQVLARH
jgi:hypothetical protein